jgi:ATP-dependent exoDNAse (exonuclease V) alpha subunit
VVLVDKMLMTLNCSLENECATLQQRNVAKLTMEKNAQDTERAMTEAKQEKLRYLDETHCANRKVTELQTRLKVVENRLNEKEAMIRALQGNSLAALGLSISDFITFYYSSLWLL